MTAYQKGINIGEFNRCTRIAKVGRTHIKSFPGANTKRLKHYSILEEENPESVIIHVRINDLLQKTMESSEDLADRIIEIGMQSKEYGAKKIFISSIIISQSIEYRKILEINEKLKDKCKWVRVY